MDLRRPESGNDIVARQTDVATCINLRGGGGDVLMDYMDSLISLHFLNRMISLQCRLVGHEKVGVRGRQ